MSEAPQNGSYTASEAAMVLGVSKRSVLNWLNDGTLEGERDEAGRWSIPAPQVEALRERREQEQRKKPPPEHGAPSRELVEALRDQIRMLQSELEDRKEESRRKDTIIAQLTQRIPAIEAPPDASGSPESATEEPEGFRYPRARRGPQNAPGGGASSGSNCPSTIRERFPMRFPPDSPEVAA